MPVRRDSTVLPGPGLTSAGHEVVWWDPNALGPPVPETFGLRQEAALQEVAGVEEEAQARYQAWQEARTERIEAGRTRTHDVVVVTASAR